MGRDRRYCTRIGGPSTADARGRCEECGRVWAEHIPIPAAWCGAFVLIATHSNGGLEVRDGTVCHLPIGHAGEHEPHPDALERGE